MPGRHDRWLPPMAQRSDGQPILELGCATGRDTATLCRAGHRVIAVDLSRPSLLAAKARVPAATFHCQNILDPFPIGEGGADIVVASLSLHYFPWDETLALVERVRRTLTPRGLLLCRLNSTNDRNFGAADHERIDDNYYRVNGQAKRFFDRRAVGDLFAAGWKPLAVEESAIDRYLLEKSVWEAVVERAA